MRAFAFVGWSGAGKTTLLERLVPRLAGEGLRVGYLKSDAHEFQMDREGKDTERLFRSGAVRVGIVSAQEGALRFRFPSKDPMALLEEFYSGCEIVLAEGFKRSPLEKLEVRAGPGSAPALDPGDSTHLAMVADFPLSTRLPVFARGDVDGIARFLLARMKGQSVRLGPAT